MAPISAMPFCRAGIMSVALASDSDQKNWIVTLPSVCLPSSSANHFSSSDARPVGGSCSAAFRVIGFKSAGRATAGLAAGFAWAAGLAAGLAAAAGLAPAAGLAAGAGAGVAGAGAAGFDCVGG